MAELMNEKIELSSADYDFQNLHMMSVNKGCTASQRGMESGDQEKCEAYGIKTASSPTQLILLLKRQYEEGVLNWAKELTSYGDTLQTQVRFKKKNLPKLG